MGRKDEIRSIDKDAPVTTFTELTDRITALIGSACREQIWVTLFAADGVQLPALFPCDDLPDDPDVWAPKLVAAFREVLCGAAAGGSLVIVRERFGVGYIEDSDKRWARALISAGNNESVPMRGISVSHPYGVTPITPDDIAG